MDRDVRNTSPVELWKQFIQYVAEKDQPMSDEDWCHEALAFAGGNIEVAQALISMTNHAVLFTKMERIIVPAEA